VANVVIDHSGSDRVGQQVAFHLREAIQRSARYRLTDETKGAYQVVLVSIDADDRSPGLSSAIGITLLLGRYYLNSNVMLVGGSKTHRLVAESGIDVITMDLVLPVVDGFEATRRLKADPRTAHVPVVALTGHTVEGFVANARAAGCDPYLTKPCLPNELIDVINGLLANPHESPSSTRLLICWLKVRLLPGSPTFHPHPRTAPST
jgi:CheY-like chemotaxis protein